MLRELTNRNIHTDRACASVSGPHEDDTLWIEPEKLTVLVLDDNPHDQVLIERTLSTIDGFEIEAHFARHVSEALDIAFKWDIDVALLDFLVGGECGPSIIPDLKKRAPNCAMILLTGQLTSEVHQHALNIGTIASLSKDDLAPERLEMAIRHGLHANHTMLELRSCREELKREQEHIAALSALSTVLPQYLSSSLEQLIGHTAAIEQGLAEGNQARQKLVRQARSARYLADDLGNYCRDILDYVEGRECAESMGQVFDLQSVVLDVSNIVAAGCKDLSVALDVSYEESPVNVYASERVFRQALVVLVGTILETLPSGSVLGARFVSNEKESLLILSKDKTANARTERTPSNQDTQSLKTLRALLAPVGVMIDVADCAEYDDDVVAQVRLATAPEQGFRARSKEHSLRMGVGNNGENRTPSGDSQECPPVEAMTKGEFHSVGVTADA